MSNEPDISPTGVSRRGFLKGLSVGTVATGLLAPDASAAAEAGRGTILGPGEVSLTLKVNGQNRAVKAEPRATLLDVLRNRLDLTGAKKVCDRGTCGACTVILDGKPVYACSLLAVEAEGRQITTVEGLGTPGKPSAVQQAFVKHDAQQCGFCTPGFVVAATAFLNRNRNPDYEGVCRGLGGNLCRCGTYAGMADAVLEAAKKGGV